MRPLGAHLHPPLQGEGGRAQRARVGSFFPRDRACGTAPPRRACASLRRASLPLAEEGEGNSQRYAARFFAKKAPDPPFPSNHSRLRLERIRGRAGRRGREGPTDLGTSRHQGDPAANRAGARINRARQRIANAALPTASPPNLRRPARGVWRLAPQDPRWADLSGAVPFFVRVQRLPTAVGTTAASGGRFRGTTLPPMGLG